MMDTLFTGGLLDEVEVFAYADDLRMVIASNSFAKLWATALPEQIDDLGQPMQAHHLYQEDKGAGQPLSAVRSPPRPAASYIMANELV